MDFNRIKEMGLEYAEKGKNAALDLAEKGKTQALIVNEQGKLLKAQRQLGALVYSLAKGKEDDDPVTIMNINTVLEGPLDCITNRLGKAGLLLGKALLADANKRK